MTSADNVGIVVTIVVVVSALGFVLTGGTGIPSDISPNIEKTTEPIKEASQEDVKKLKDIESKILEDTSEKTKQITEQVKEVSQTVKEPSTSKLPARLISIPSGTSLPGCEQNGLCYDPSSLIIFKGGEII